MADETKKAVSDTDFSQAVAAYASSLSETDNVVNRSYSPAFGSQYNSFRNIDTNISVRSGYDRKDYERFRPSEAIPTRFEDIMGACDSVYERVSIVKNIFDLMSDFGSQGIEIIHPNKNIQTFHRNWFKKVNGKERSERFFSLLFRRGNLIVRRNTIKASTGFRMNLQKGLATPNLPTPKNEKVAGRELPISYSFVDVANVDVVGGILAPFVGKYKYFLKVPKEIDRLIKAGDKNVKALLNDLPADLVDAIKTNKPFVLEPERTFSYFYKKDDWQLWAKPLLYSLLGDLIILEKMKLADLTALDNVISMIRIWKLGDLESRMLPDKATFAKLGNILNSVPGGGTIDLMWGPDLQFEQHIPDVQKILDSNKYDAVMGRIFSGLGIPPTLTGLSSSAGFTNNYVSLKTLLERLQYGREILTSFWEQELKFVQKSMGFRLPAKVRFNRMTLTDDSSEKALLIQLAERNIITWETLLERFGEDPDLERMRYRSERRLRMNGSIPKQAGPWHDPDLLKKNLQRLKEIALQSGVVTPSEIGLELDAKSPGEENRIKMEGKNRPPMAKGAGVAGRPKTSKDKTKRKKKSSFIRTSASEIQTAVWANRTMKALDGYLNPVFLEKSGKSNLRQLTTEEADTLQNLKFLVLSHITPKSNPDYNDISNILNTNPTFDSRLTNLYSGLLKAHQNPSLEDIRQLQTLSYSVYKNLREK